MDTSSTVVFGIVIPSANPIFLSVVGAHVLLGLGCVLSGLAAMLATKERGYHSTFGTMYYWFMIGVFLTMTTLAFMRWSEDYALFVLGVMAFALVTVGRFARSYGLNLRVHATSMASSYIVVLTAFYVDNGKNLPLWRDLPAASYWLVPVTVGASILLWVFARHPLLQKRS
jgi:uncharacterized paraquat-inducible protein A